MNSLIASVNSFLLVDIRDTEDETEEKSVKGKNERSKWARTA